MKPFPSWHLNCALGHVGRGGGGVAFYSECGNPQYAGSGLSNEHFNEPNITCSVKHRIQFIIKSRSERTVRGRRVLRLQLDEDQLLWPD